MEQEQEKLIGDFVAAVMNLLAAGFGARMIADLLSRTFQAVAKETGGVKL